jgi:hypothetical protein
VVLVVVELGGVGQQAGQPLQVAGGELVQHASDLGLGRVPQQHHHQLPRLGMALLEPGAPPPSGLLVIQPARVGHPRSPPPAAGGRARQAQPGAAQDARPAAWLVPQLVGGIVQAGANQPVTDHPQAALAATGPTDPNPGPGDKDAQPNSHGGAPFQVDVAG